MDRRRRSALGRTTAALAAFVFSALALLLGGPSPALGAVARERRQLGVNYLDALNQGYQGRALTKGRVLGAGRVARTTTRKKLGAPAPTPTKTKTKTKTSTSKTRTKSTTKRTTSRTVTRATSSLTKTASKTASKTATKSSTSVTPTRPPTTNTNTPTRTATRTATAAQASMVAAVSTVVPISIPVGSSIAVTMDLPTYCLSSCYIYGFLGVQPGDSAAAEAYLGTNAGSANSKAFGISASERDAKIIQPARLFSISRADSAFTSACPSSGSFACTIKLVVNNTGSGTLDALATILADGNPIQDSKSVANTTARMAFALATGNSSFVTGDELRASIYKEAKKLDWAPRAIEMIWGAVAGWTQVIGATWQATHEAIVFNIIDTASTTPFIVSNYDYVSGGNSKNTLAVAGNSLGGLGGRFVAYGGNPLHDLQYPGRGSLWNAAFKQMVKNSVRWVLSDTTPSKITLAHIEDSYWFHHDNSTLYALKEFYPTATINGINACESANLATCLVGSDLLVISSSSDANTNFEAVTSAVYDFLLKGKPVLYLHFGSYDNTLMYRLIPFFGVSYKGSNYWTRSGLSSSNVVDTNGTISTASAFFKGILDVLTGVNPLVAADIEGCWNVVNQWPNCGIDGFKTKVLNPFNSLQSMLQSLDSSGQDLFAQPGKVTLKQLVLLSDKYRADNFTAPDNNTPALAYPIPKNRLDLYAAAMFADMSPLLLRAEGKGQGDLGSLTCPNTVRWQGRCWSGKYDIRSYADTVPLSKQVIEHKLIAGDAWTSTGLFAMPDKQITVRRLDNNTDISAGLHFWFQRMGVTKSTHLSSGNMTRYERPQYARSGMVKVVGVNSVQVITPPLGGPIYIYYGGVSSYRDAGKDTSITLKFEFGNVAKHASLLDISNETLLDQFIATAASNPLPVVDIKGDGFEIHARKDKFWDGIINRTMPETDQASDAPKMLYGGSNGLRIALDDFRYHFFRNQYITVGWKPPGLTLNESIPAPVQAICRHLNYTECWDTKINSPFNIQHTNYDEDANCGNGCSGNPWDADWEFKTVAWGEGHELGHNLQKSWFNTEYYPNADRNTWSKVQRTVGEASNNVFPYYNKWRWFRLIHNYNGKVYDGHMNQKHVWSIAQSAYLNLTATVNGQLQRVTYDASCNLISSYPLDWSPHDIIHDSIFKANWDSNGAKMTFYHQIPGKVSGILLADNKTKVDDGFFWIPLMYTLGRMVEYHGSDETRWLNNRDRLGFGLFNRTGDPTYGTFDVRGIPGGDMFLIGLSLVTGRDWRPVMDAYGIRTTDLARAQVQAHINSDRVWGGPMPVEYAVLEDDLYMFPTWNVSRVPIDTYAVWPRDSFTPQLCDATAGKTRTQTVTTTASKTRTTSTSATRTIATMALSITAKATSTPVVAPAGTEFIVNVAMPYACNVGSQGCGLEGFINIEAGQPRAWAGVQALGFSAVAVQNLTATQLSSRGVKAFNLNTTQIADLVGVCTSTQWQQGDCLFVVGVVDANSALRGAITLVADTQAPATSGQEFRVVRAVASADPSFASAADLRAELSNEVDRIKSLAQSSINDLYGNGSGGKLNNISIYPTHDAALYTISDSTMAWPVLFSNYENWNGNPALGNLLVPAGVTAGGAGGRFIAWPSSPFWLNVAGDAQKLLKNSLLWLNRGIDPASLLEDYIVVTAQLPGQSSYWFSYDTVTYNQMKSFYPRATIPTINSCDNSMLRGCLTNAKLLIIGNQMGKDGDSSAPNSTTNAAEVVTAVRDFLAAGGAVMYTHYSQNSNDLTTGLLGLMGLTFKSSNYWPRYGIQNGTFAVAAGNYTALDPCGSLRAAADTLGGTTPLVDADLASCYGVAANWEKCTNTNFTSKIGTALATVRSNIWSLESMGLPLFLRNGFTWLKLAVLLGDKYRTATSGDTPSSLYPVTRSNPHTFARAAFADASLAFLRAQGVRSASGGTLYCNRTAVLAGTCSVSLSTSVSTSTVFVSDALPASDDSVALDYFALPGVPFTIARNDSVNPNVSISVAFWPRMNLPGVFRLDGSNVTYFDRPAFANTILAGNSIPLLPGRSLTITVPYGAPLGLTFSSTGNVSSSPRPNYGVILSGVATIGEWNAAAGTSISKTVACTDYGVDQGTTAISTVVVGLASAPSDLTPTSCTFGTSNYAGNRTGAVFVGNTAYTDTATAAHFVCAAFESPYIKLITFKAVVSAGAGSISVVAAKYCSNTDASITKTSLISTSAMQNCWNTGSGGGYQLTGVARNTC